MIERLKAREKLSNEIVSLSDQQLAKLISRWNRAQVVLTGSKIAGLPAGTIFTSLAYYGLFSKNLDLVWFASASAGIALTAAGIGIFKGKSMKESIKKATTEVFLRSLKDKNTGISSPIATPE